MDDVTDESSQSSDTSDDFDAVEVTQTLREQVGILDSCTDERQLLAALEAINDILDSLPGLADQSDDFVTPPENIDKPLQPAFDAAVHVKVTDVIKKFITPNVNHRELSSQQNWVLYEAFYILTNLTAWTEEQTKLVTDADLCLGPGVLDTDKLGFKD